jgi:hypothetical protein
MRRALAAVICVAALGLCGCGGGGDENSDTGSAPASTTPGSASAPRPSPQSAAGQGKAKQAEGSAAKAKDANKHSDSSPQSTATVEVPPISSAPIAGSTAPAPGVKTVKGGDNSVQTYGVESGASERTEAAIALAAYLDARLEGNWQAACEALAQRPKEELDKLAQQLQSQGKGAAGCAGAMEALGEGASQQRKAAPITEVLSLRSGGDVPGDPSYLIFTGPPQNALYSMPMYLQGGGWKVGLAQPSELPV